jgi:hypothetical protein
MNLQTKIIQKIKADLANRSIKNQIKPLVKSGESEIEYDYQYCVHPDKEYDGVIFVISKKIMFHNQQIRDSQYQIYPYDLKGNYLIDYDIKGKCIGGFFRKIQQIA